ncbi:MAG: serine/threonine-protein phosphatase [Bacteroidales bacterium]|nr:serine/threonine-protein phosphatase [Bacteroidales bacterium]
MNDDFYIEVACEQRNYGNERICGDVFLSRKIREENRTIAVLSDGMGHGVKANVLATLTATMSANFTFEHKDHQTIADIIMNTLPVCSERHMSYSTFTIVDIESNGLIRILEYDNPRTIIMRNNKYFDPKWKNSVMETDKNKGKEIRSCSFEPRKEDRILFFSDGITQSGLGTEKYPLGWGHENLIIYIEKTLKSAPGISAVKLAEKIVNMAYRNDSYHAKDDTSCASIYFREPRRLLISTGPPYEKEKDEALGKTVKEFKGKKIVCGATTADIIARELGVKIEDSLDFTDPDLPPVSSMSGIDLVTEGILTITKVTRILKEHTPGFELGNGPADRIIKMVKESDEIEIIIGTRINIAHQDPSLPVELEIRRTVVKRMARLLEEKFLKEVSIRYI